MRVLAVIALLLWAGPALAVGADEKMLPDPAQETRARQLMEDLRCLVCQNQSISDSNADLARDLREIVRERVAEGESDAQVRKYMVDRYGDWILMKPPFNIRTAILWLAPLLFIIAGGLGAWAFIRRQRPVRQAEALDPDEQARLRALLDEAP
ncbi:cytochrome c-type biogenesis protein [Emcibacter sp. SYSU 3D8]|uniref:cytochrome c-type biogenesis protein n=1 Tax=Emcibacter sp. SYSU 3D8 TaxID=3133969 RepID=UPI0031FEC31B